MITKERKEPKCKSGIAVIISHRRIQELRGGEISLRFPTSHSECDAFFRAKMTDKHSFFRTILLNPIHFYVVLTEGYLEGWPNMAARLAGWRRVTRKVRFCTGWTGRTACLFFTVPVAQTGAA
jgi:hypothetical protein